MVAPRTRKRPTKPLKDRPQKQRFRADRILYGRGRRGPRPKYDREVHPASIVAYFQGSLDAIQEVERVVTERGDVKHVQTPVKPPTISGWAAEAGVCRETVWAWGEKYEEFEDAIKRAKGIQEQVFLTMGALGAYNPNVVIFMLKNLQGWLDKVEQTHRGAVNLRFDAQDANA